MRNKKAANEWLEKAWHDLETARFLYEANHFTDVIGTDLQQAIEKTLKAISAFHNKKIVKTHNLTLLLDDVKDIINVPKEEYYPLCELATLFYKEGRYPTFDVEMPKREEIKQVLDMANDLYNMVKYYIEKTE